MMEKTESRERETETRRGSGAVGHEVEEESEAGGTEKEEGGVRGAGRGAGRGGGGGGAGGEGVEGAGVREGLENRTGRYRTGKRCRKKGRARRECYIYVCVYR